MKQTPSKVSQNRQNAQQQPPCVFFSGQKHQKIYADLYGSTIRQSIKHIVNYVPMKIIPIVQKTKSLTESKLQNSVNKFEQIKKIRQETVIELKILHQLQKAKNQKQAKLQSLNLLYKKIVSQRQMLAQLALKGEELKYAIEREKQDNQRLANSLVYQTNISIYNNQTQSIHYSKILQGKQDHLSKLKNSLQDITLITASKRLRIKQLLVQVQEIKKVIVKNLQNMSELNKGLHAIQNQIAISQIQISVLRMQSNPSLRVGFSTVSLNPQFDRTRVLQKNSIIWPKNKTRSLSNNQIRDFLIIQLYPTWMKMLNKLSSQFTGYRQLLCYQIQSQQSKIQDLTLYFPKKNPNARFTNNKTRSIVVLHSPIVEDNKKITDIMMEMSGLKNRVINILSVRIEQFQDNLSQLQISYEYLGSQRLKKIEIIILKTLTRQNLIKYLPNQTHDKIVLLKIQIPLIFHSIAQKLQYQQVYELIRRCKC